MTCTVSDTLKDHQNSPRPGVRVEAWIDIPDGYYATSQGDTVTHALPVTTYTDMTGNWELVLIPSSLYEVRLESTGVEDTNITPKYRFKFDTPMVEDVLIEIPDATTFDLGTQT